MRPIAIALAAWPLAASVTSAATGPRTPIWPTEVDRIAAPLYRQLDPDRRVDDRERVAAVQALAAFTTDAIEPALLVALEDPAMPVQREALQACYARGLASCVPRAVQLWRDGRESTIRIAALRVVAMAPKGHAGLLRDALRDPGETIRAQAAQFLGWSPLAEGERARARRALLAKLADLSAVVRRHVVDSLGLIGDADVVLPVARVLEDPEPTVRAAAATALARLHDDRAVPPLRRALDEPNEPLVTKALVRALAQLGDDEVEAALLELLDDPPTGLDTPQVADAIGRRPKPGATLVGGLIERLREPGQREAAVDALRMLGEPTHPRLREALARGLEPPLAVELEALLGEPGLGLPTHPTPPAANDIVGWHARLHDGALDERLEAGAQLGALAPPWLDAAVAGMLHPRASLERRRGWLVALATSPRPIDSEGLSPWIRLAGWLGDPRRSDADRCLAAAAISAAAPGKAGRFATDTLRERASDPRPDVRACAALGLGRLGDTEGVAIALADPASRVRTAAAFALADRDLEPSEATEGRLRTLAAADPQGNVRTAARAVLAQWSAPSRAAAAGAEGPWWSLEPAPEFGWASGPAVIPGELVLDGVVYRMRVPALTTGTVRWAWLPSLRPDPVGDP